MCVIISLSSMNYPDVIPQVFSHCVENHLPSLESAKARLSAIQQIREGLIKSTGIVGAARTGTAMRTLAKSIPEEYRETTMHSPRATESVEHARERGRKFWSNIYSRNRVFDPEATVKASPDYAFIVRGTFICCFRKLFLILQMIPSSHNKIRSFHEPKVYTKRY